MRVFVACDHVEHARSRWRGQEEVGEWRKLRNSPQHRQFHRACWAIKFEAFALTARGDSKWAREVNHKFSQIAAPEMCLDATWQRLIKLCEWKFSGFLSHRFVFIIIIQLQDSSQLCAEPQRDSISVTIRNRLIICSINRMWIRARH